MSGVVRYVEALDGPWRVVGWVLVGCGWLGWKAIQVPSRNVLRSLGWQWMAFLWVTWWLSAGMAIRGWDVLEAERKNLDDALAIQAGGLRFLGRTKRKVQLVFSAKLHYAAWRLEVGTWLLVGSWALTLLWTWWLAVLPVVGFGRRLLRSRRNWWERA